MANTPFTSGQHLILTDECVDHGRPVAVTYQEPVEGCEDRHFVDLPGWGRHDAATSDLKADTTERAARRVKAVELEPGMYIEPYPGQVYRVRAIETYRFCATEVCLHLVRHCPGEPLKDKRHDKWDFVKKTQEYALVENPTKSV